MSHTSYLTFDQRIVGDIYTSAESMDNLSILCDDFGSRFGGTEGERLAAEFIKTKFEEYGLSNVHLEPIKYLGWTRGEVKFEIVSPIQKVIPCITLPHSPAVEIEGVIIDMKGGAPKDFTQRADEIKGKIVMVNSVFNPKNIKRWVHRNEKFGRSLLAGATGFIFVNHYPGYGPATGGIGYKGKAALIPGISISKENGAFLQRVMKRKGTVNIRLTTTDQLSPMTSWNIVGDLLGDQYPEEIIMLGSHYDGHDIAQGAGDPASGTVAVMESARVLAKHAPPLPRTIRFALWGVEEIGLLGSKAYVRAHIDELKNIRFYLNMDAAGTAASKDIMLHEWPELQGTFEHYRDEMVSDYVIGQSFHASSDHYPFLLAGVATGGIEAIRESRSGRGYGHTFYDTVDKVTQTGMRDASSLAARLALRMTDDDDWPVSQRGEESINKLLEQPGQGEKRALNKRLDVLYAQT
ncbi:MAG: M28 family peptidase [Chloroflexota bacterium]|nr:M28 family peptidase [Chloroflexota bacterium]